MHLGSADRQRERQAAHQPAQILVRQSRRRQRQRRFRGHLSPQATAALVSDSAGFGMVAGLSLSRAGARHAPASDWNQPVQIRRVQAEPVDHARPQPRLLEARKTLSRRHRMDDRQGYLDAALELLRRPGRRLFGVSFRQLQDVKRQVPEAVCDSYLVNGSRNLIVNRGAPPFDNPELRHAMSLTLDRQAFIDIMGQGQGAIGGPMEPPPEGLWGMPAETLKALPGYGADIARRRAEARQIMEKIGYGPGKRLAVTVAARNVPPWRDPALILIDQLKEIYIDGELEAVDTTQWYPRLKRKDYKIGLNVTESEVDDPDAQFYENYKCGALRN